jgi:hypothetical protein
MIIDGIYLVFVRMRFDFHKNSFDEKIFLNQSSIDLNLLVLVLSPMVIDKLYEMDLYHYQLIVVRCRHIEQKIVMILLNLKMEIHFERYDERNLQGPRLCFSGSLSRRNLNFYLVLQHSFRTVFLPVSHRMRAMCRLINTCRK